MLCLHVSRAHPDTGRQAVFARFGYPGYPKSDLVMSAKVLTPLAVKAAKPKRQRYEIPDGGAVGLYLVVQPSGVKSWAHRYGFNGTRRKDTLGSVSEVSLGEARRLVAEARHLREQGIDPAAQRRAAHATTVEMAERHETDSVEALSRLFIERYAKKRRTWQQTEDTFRRLILPKWRGRTVHDVKRRDVIDLAEGIATDRPYMANRTLATLSKFFAWCVACDILEVSPASGIEAPGREVTRDRILDDDELRRLWIAAGDPAEGLFGVLARLLLLTGQRRGEVSGMRWSEIGDDHIWRLPGARTKNGKPHQVPLAPAAWDLIQAQPRFAGSDFVLTFDGTRPISGFGRAKRRLSAKAGITADWRLHDLRRSCASGLQRLGVRAEVIERCLNHIGGLYRGVSGTYQRDPLIEETTAALERWADHVEQLVTGKPAKILKLR
jgi:integrase